MPDEPQVNPEERLDLLLQHLGLAPAASAGARPSAGSSSTGQTRFAGGRSAAISATWGANSPTRWPSSSGPRPFSPGLPASSPSRLRSSS